MNPKALVLAATLLLMQGCANNDFSTAAPDDIAHSISVIKNDFSNSDIYAAPQLTHSWDFAASYAARLAAVKFKETGKVTDTVAITWTYMGKNWMFFRSATLKGPIQLPVAIGARNVDYCSSAGNCTYRETISAELPRSALVNASGTGLVIRVNSAAGYVDVQLPPNYVQGYLKGISGI
ncbi:hypothetical protein PVT67_15540 [Gallaecimonas kandeliae]|uniref:hypothetical protein n=1 Tax=Gallaecimonas kandeliae TaxID=3029055 RepID=UPI0026493F23|nr:hypothetical protein [Gallaecimonas kandeliae]WKE65056.1 hypothetical protein PVT67_15540 [Gallaecimonas kandeliae]